jgi:hypothetical protein
MHDDVIELECHVLDRRYMFQKYENRKKGSIQEAAVVLIR